VSPELAEWDEDRLAQELAELQGLDVEPPFAMKARTRSASVA
jgi:hypothetical protein